MESEEFVGPVVVHSEGTVRYANEEGRALLGVDSSSDLVGRSLREFVPEGHWEPLSEQFAQIVDETPALGLRVELDRADGTSREVVAVSSPVEWEGTRRIHTSFLDISGAEDSLAVSLRENAMHEAPIGITIADPSREDEPLVYVNDGFVELTGYPREEIIGRNCRFLQGEATREEPVVEIRRAIEAQEPVSVELRNYRKDGSMFWNRVTISPVEDESGTVTHYLGFQEDVSEAKLYEREKTLFEKHAEASNQMMFVTDRAGTIEYVNPAFERVTGYSAPEVIGKTPSVLRSGEQDDSFYRNLWETIESGAVWEGKLTNRTKSGELFQVRQTIVPVVDDRGAVTHFTAIERDVTDEQITQQVLNVLDRVLRHNVRTAVNVIDGYAEFLEADLEDPKQRTAAQSIQERSSDLKKISERISAIRELLDGHDEPVELELSDIETIIDRAGERYERARISSTVDVDGERAVKYGSVLQLALDAAIENAVEHNDRETPSVDITVTQLADEERVAIKISDDGPGIPDSEWEIIKAGSETPLRHSSGIGLWVLYWSVVALGGTVERSDNEPRGTVLTLKVPLASESKQANGE